jgi:hypothetical protein
MYHVMLNLYNDIKSRIVYKHYVSNVFPCLNGVKRQGEHLSISFFLCALYLNNWEKILTIILTVYHKEGKLTKLIIIKGYNLSN